MPETEDLKGFFDSSALAVVIVNAVGVIEYSNAVFIELTGLRPGELVGWHILKTGSMTEEQCREVREALRSGRSWQREFHIARRTGEECCLAAAVHPVQNRAGTISQFIGVIREMTDRKLLFADRAKLLLTKREIEVLSLLAKGFENSEIANELVISIRTVGHHVSNILHRLEVANRTAAVASAHLLGLLPDASEQGGGDLV